MFHNQPLPSVSEFTSEIFLLYQTTHEFYDEVRYREEFNRYCQWYYKTAEQNRQELEKMQHDINILGWFYRGWGG